MPVPEPSWIVARCRSCSGLAKFDPTKLGAPPTCPACGTVLSLPPPSAPVWSEAVRDPSALISHLPNRKPSDPLDSSRVKQTNTQEMVSLASERVRVKRKSKRVMKQLTSWEQSREELDRERHPQPTPAWLRKTKIALLALVSAALLGLMVYGVIASMREGGAISEPEKAETGSSPFSELEAASFDRTESKRVYARARAAAEQFLDAATWQERLSFCRDPKRVRMLMAEDHSNPARPDGPVARRPLPDQAKVVVNGSLILLSIEMDDFSRRPLAIERLSDDRYRVDWESWVGHCEIPWDELGQRRSALPFRLRARMLRRDYYNHGFQDERWTSWQLEDRTGQHRIFGYVEHQHPVLIQLESAARSQATNRPIHVLLEVRFPQSAPAGDQVEITKIITLGWVDTTRDDG